MGVLAKKTKKLPKYGVLIKSAATFTLLMGANLYL